MCCYCAPLVFLGFPVCCFLTSPAWVLLHLAPHQPPPAWQPLCPPIHHTQVQPKWSHCGVPLLQTGRPTAPHLNPHGQHQAWLEMKAKRVGMLRQWNQMGSATRQPGRGDYKKLQENVHWAKTAWMLKTAGATIKSPLIPFPQQAGAPCIQMGGKTHGPCKNEEAAAAVRVWPGAGAAALSQRSGLVRVGLGDAGRGQAGRLGQGGHGARAPHDTESMSSPSSPMGMFWNTFPQRVQQVCRGDNPDIRLVDPFPTPPGS